jgi:hypothetical protein
VKTMEDFKNRLSVISETQPKLPNSLTPPQPKAQPLFAPTAPSSASALRMNAALSPTSMRPRNNGVLLTTSDIPFQQIRKPFIDKYASESSVRDRMIPQTDTNDANERIEQLVDYDRRLVELHRQMKVADLEAAERAETALKQRSRDAARCASETKLLGACVKEQVSEVFEQRF